MHLIQEYNVLCLELVRCTQTSRELGTLQGIPGFGSLPVPYSHPNYDEAPYREVRFRDTFANSTLKCEESEYIKIN